MLDDLHLLLPPAASVDIRGVCDGFQPFNLIGGKLYLRSLNETVDMARLSDPDDRHNSFGKRPRYSDIRSGGILASTDRREHLSHHLQLRQLAVVSLRAVATFRQRILGAVLTTQCTLLQYHIPEKWNALASAVVEDAGVFWLAVEQAVMVLNSLYMEAGFAQDLVGECDLGQIVVRDSNVLDLSAFEQRNQLRSPPSDIGRIVYPVDVNVVCTETCKALLKHIRDWMVTAASGLRRELRRELILVATVMLQQIAEQRLRPPHAVDNGSVPQIQASIVRLVHNLFKALLRKAASEVAIADLATIAPGPGTEND